MSRDPLKESEYHWKIMTARSSGWLIASERFCLVRVFLGCFGRVHRP